MALEKNLLIVGGTGFIGSHLIKHYSNKYRITSISKKSSTISQKIVNVNHINFDLENSNAAKNFFSENKFNFIINCGGYVDHKDFLTDNNNIFNNHFKITLNILRYTINYKPKKFIQIGSSDEYGYHASCPKEDSKENPFSPYSLGKLASTQACMIFAKQYNYPVIVIRPFLIYGPGQAENRLIPYIINSCLKNKEFNLGKKDIIRDFLYINDFLEFVDEILNKPSINGQIFNVGSGSGTSIETLVRKILQILDKGKPSFGKYNSDKFENPILVANLEKVNNLLRWRPKTDIVQGIKETIESYRNKK